MPRGVDRYSKEMTLHWIDDAFPFFVPDEDALYREENRELVDQFICYIGEYFVRYCGGRWINDPTMRLFHDFGPTIRYDWTEEGDYPGNLLFDAADQGFGRVRVEWSSRAADYAAAHGLENERLELRRKYGLA